jgi:hypothetical protein
MEVPQARTGWSGGLINLIPSTTGGSLFTAKTRERRARARMRMHAVRKHMRASATHRRTRHASPRRAPAAPPTPPRDATNAAATRGAHAQAAMTCPAGA